MKNSEFLKKSGFKVLTGDAGLDREIKDVYVGDLLSRVMSGATPGSAWITIHTHMNILAVATLNELPLVIIPENIQVPSQVIDKAVEEDIMLLSADCTAYKVCLKCAEILGE